MKKLITNFLLTGEIKAGKTTVLNNVLDKLSSMNLTIKGFKTIPVFKNNEVVGFYLQHIGGEKRLFAHLNINSHLRFNRYKIKPGIFDEFGCFVLNDAFFNADLIIMDEIGLIEKSAHLFIESIIECLNSSKIVLGVFQERANWFYELIVNRIDIKIFEITTHNRSYICNNIASDIKNCFLEKNENFLDN